jgi:hypothetical protein
MKKNLQNALLLAMGLMTTVSFAQDWNVDSRTRIDMSGDFDRMETAQRATLGYTFGGSDWSIHGSSVVNYDLGMGQVAGLAVYEAYASTDLMGYASLTAGRQALNYGSGMIVGSNEWGTDRNTRDAFTFDLGLDMADVTLGYASRMNGDELTNGGTSMWLNAAKSEGDWTANLLYASTTMTQLDVDQDADTYMGLDLAYNMMDGNLTLNVGYNTADAMAYNAEGEGARVDMDMTIIGATYNVNESMSISASQTSYGDDGFAVAGSNMGNGINGEDYNSWTSTGTLGHLAPNDKNMSIGGAYNMGEFDLGVTMHTISNDNNDDYERNVMEMSLGYSMSDNANLSLMYATDDNRYAGAEEETYMYLTLTVTP